MNSGFVCLLIYIRKISFRQPIQSDCSVAQLSSACGPQLPAYRRKAIKIFRDKAGQNDDFMLEFKYSSGP